MSETILTQIKPGIRVQIQRMEAEAPMMEKLRSMGLGRTHILKVLKSGPKQPMLVTVNGTESRIAISPEITDKIWVCEI